MLSLHTCQKSVEPTPAGHPQGSSPMGPVGERCLTQHINLAGGLFTTTLQNHRQSPLPEVLHSWDRPHPCSGQ